jgi:hypothetical protein
VNIRCWWSGHYYRTRYDEDKTYHECTRCGNCVKNVYWDDNRGFYEKYEGWFTALVIALVMVAFMGFIIYLVSYLPCKSQGTLMELPWKWDFISGCYFNVQDRWIATGLLDIVDLLK